MLFRHLLSITILASILNITGCTTPPVSQPEQMGIPSTNHHTYTVQPGDTLYTIAKRFGKSAQDLARLNQLEPPYKIYPNQILTINQPCSYCKQIYRGNRSSPLPSSPKKECYPPISWQWPIQQPLKVTSQSGQKGINIFGTSAQPIYAAAPGTVTHSENLTNGYHSLIIQHNNAFSSVYGHLRHLQVKTEHRVTPGQLIAKMETDASRQSSFYFEIRCWDKSLNPLDYLPAKK